MRSVILRMRILPPPQKAKKPPAILPKPTKAMKMRRYSLTMNPRPKKTNGG